MTGGSFTTVGDGTWTADFTGYALVYLWGGGAGGGGGVSVTRGGPGGGGSALSVSLIPVISGVVYHFHIGDGGVGGNPGGGNGVDGQATYWGDGTLYYCAPGKAGTGAIAGQGGAVADSRGDSRIAGTPGDAPAGFSLAGAAGGAGGGALGGAGGVSPGNAVGNDGDQPGGGGSGGGGNSSGHGGKGGAGQVLIVEAPDVKPGYYSPGITLSPDGDTYDAVGIYDLTAPADGIGVVECYGSGGGGRGGNGFFGGAGGGGGAGAMKAVNFYRDVIYQRVVPAGGAGSPYNNGATVDGADALFRHKQLTVTNKVLLSNVATLTISGKHGYDVGDTVTVAGVDATFNGPALIIAINAARTTFSYNKSAANVASTSATGNVNYLLVKAAGGKRSLGSNANPGQGGAVVDSIGDEINAGGVGVPSTSSSLLGGIGGSGGLPGGGLAGIGGFNSELGNPGNAGTDGQIPGCGGGGGKGSTGGNGGDGARGASFVRYFISLGTVVEDGVKRYIVRITYKDTSGVLKNVVEPYILRSGQKVSLKRMHQDADSWKRKKPPYIPVGYEGRFDLDTGTFNWKYGATHIRPSIVNNTLSCAVLGDSVSEGFNSLEFLGLTGTADYPHAFPRRARDQIIDDPATSATLGGTGFIRAISVNGGDDSWAKSGNAWTNNGHYLSSSNVGSTMTWTTPLAGNTIAIVTSGGGASVVIDGVTKTPIAATAGNSTLQRTVYGGLSSGTHTVVIKPVAGGVVLNLFGADCYVVTSGVPIGIKVHNFSQGGSRATKGASSAADQSLWDRDGVTAPGSMLASYKQSSIFCGGTPQAGLIFLGGNDSFSGSTKEQIAYGGTTGDHTGGVEHIGQVWQAANTGGDVILMPDVHTKDRNGLLMQLALDNNWAMIDFHWLTRELTDIFGLHYNGDQYGHPNNDGHIWVGAMMSNAFLNGPT